MSEFHGHRNWNHWNVSLWLNNDEGLYALWRDHYRRERTRDRAAKAVKADLAEMGITHTPDGAPYSLASIRATMRD